MILTRKGNNWWVNQYGNKTFFAFATKSITNEENLTASLNKLIFYFLYNLLLSAIEIYCLLG
jgi:hypothetical protein